MDIQICFLFKSSAVTQCAHILDWHPTVLRSLTILIKGVICIQYSSICIEFMNILLNSEIEKKKLKTIMFNYVLNQNYVVDLEVYSDHCKCFQCTVVTDDIPVNITKYMRMHSEIFKCFRLKRLKESNTRQINETYVENDSHGI